ncbi:MAG TPA: alpha-mannosidase [Symbiobacteriaceae bacterium]|nr:alpha-mannosidase [Symbiobacteriaceae bacterium]
MAPQVPTDPRHSWLVEKLERRIGELREYIWAERRPIGPLRFREEAPAASFRPDFDDRAWELRSVGDTWGRPGLTAWFRATVEIPAGWAAEPLALRLGFGPTLHANTGGAEALLYVDGEPLQALDRNHGEVLLPPAMAARGRLALAVHAFSGMRQGDHRIGPAELVRRAPAAEAICFNMYAALQAALVLPDGDHRRVAMLEALNAASVAIDWRQPGSPAFYASLEAARAALAEGLAPLQGEPGRPQVVAVGHSHIDVAWLWPLWVTRQKAARTFSTVLHLMDQYPEYRFIQSQPQLYRYIKDDHPELYRRIRERVREGRWEPTGAMWVEPDCNIPSGESLVRQILLGTRFFQDEFGVANRVLWLPDVFGYSWALPQIMERSGLKYFMTTKISWSQFNRYPYDTFKWRGLDGTEILTHFITTPTEDTWFYTYNGEMDSRSIAGLWANYAQKPLNRELLHAYGYGDGGGGPTREMLETARRFADLPGLPQVRTGSVEEYFRDLEARVDGRPDLPVWDGELYLEYHRGTYTSQARNKRFNRKAELLYHDAEFLAAAASILAPGFAYPGGLLKQGWELILLNQFHDILPGSSIAEVYADSARDYDRVFALGREAAESAVAALTEAMDRPQAGLVVFNTLPWERSDYVVVDHAPGGARPALPCQEVHGEDGSAQWLVYCADVPSCGWASFPLGDAPNAVAPAPVRVTAERLENDYFLVELNQAGQISRLYDKRAGREVLPDGARANVLQAFEDKPLRHDAWDIDIYYQEKCYEVADLQEAAVEEAGPERGVLRLVWKYGQSTVTQRLMLYRRLPRIDFQTHVDWQERQTLLKAAFPVDVRATSATYDIQFGNVERPTHWNTSWDWARFETCAHKWVDLSEGNYGVSLLNDCKYGHDVRGNVVRLTLLKGAIEPDPGADLGEHGFTYSLFPHAGDWFTGGTVPAAYGLNVPLLARFCGPARGALPARHSFVAADADHIVLETVKGAEDGDGLVLRLCEFGRRRGEVRLKFGFPVAGAEACNLMEVPEEPVPVRDEGLAFSTRPFKLHTFRVR